MLRGVSLIVQTTFRDGLLFDPFLFFQNSLTTTELNIGRRQVVQAFMLSLMILMMNELLDLFFKIAW